MERNSIGQVIIKESGSLLLSIPCITSTISVNTYNRFLLDEREFTELTPTIDKDALINRLENDIITLNNNINILNANLTQEQINARGGCNVGIAKVQTATKGTNERIGFDIIAGNEYYNAIQTNGKPVYDIVNKGATLYKEANSRRFYTFKATINYRYRYIGLNPIDQSNAITKIQFWKFTNGSSSPIGDGVERADNIQATYKPGDTTGLYTINLLDAGQGLGGETDFIYLPVREMPDNFIMEIYPGSTFTVIPE
jgi:hypothetical protein